MNWTGGALGRSRHAKASVTAIQKAHFAKARSRRERTPVDLPDFEIFEKPVSSANSKKGGKNCSAKSQSDSRNRIAFEKPWKTSHPQAIQQRKSTKSGESHSKATSHHKEGRRRSPITISSRPSSSPSSQRRSEEVLERQDTRDPSLDPREKSPTSLPDVIEFQRARLLETRDWVGISHSKPTKVKFTDSNDRDQIGKRRHLDLAHEHVGHHKRRYHSQQRPANGFVAASDRFSQADISVRIGSAVDRRSARHEQSRRSLSKLDQVSSISDEMLLDDLHSHRSVSSHNAFRLPRSTDNIYADQLLRHHDRGLTPSAFMKGPDDFQADRSSANGQFDGLRPQGERVRSDHAPIARLQSSPLSEPLLVMRMPNGENTPIRFAFAKSPNHLNETSRERSTTPAKRGSKGIRESRRDVDQSVQVRSAETSILTASRGRKFKTPPHQFDSRQAVHDHVGQAYVEGQGTVQRGQTSATLKTDLHESVALSKAMAAEKTASPLDLSFQREARLYPEKVSVDEEEGWQSFINYNPPEEPSPLSHPPCSGVAVTPMAATTHPAETKAIEAINQNDQAAKDEYEALWRSFVFEEDNVQQEWTMDSQTEAEMQRTGQNRSPADPAEQTQTSMEAENATSPIKQNAHLLEQSASSSTPASKLNQASQIAHVSSTSQMTNSDELLDNVQQHNRSSSPLRLSMAPHNRSSDPSHGPDTRSSSNLAQVATSPLTTVESRTRSTPAGPPSSLIAQASTRPTVPAQPSSDELAWSPSRLSQATGKSAVVFKKPARYVGQRAPSPAKTVRLGVKKKAANEPNKGTDSGGTSRIETERAWRWDLAEDRDEMQEDDEIEDD